MKNKTFKNILTIFGISGILANSITLTSTFLYAYFNNYKVLVTINTMNEANIELIILIAINITGMCAWVKMINDIMEIHHLKK